MKAASSRATSVALFLFLILLLNLFVPFAGAAFAQQQTPPSAAQEGFVPVDELPQDEALPAAPLLITAYAAAWIVLLLYVWSIWRRLARVERELADVGRRGDAGARR